MVAQTAGTCWLPWVFVHIDYWYTAILPSVLSIHRIWRLWTGTCGPVHTMSIEVWNGLLSVRTLTLLKAIRKAVNRIVSERESALLTSGTYLLSQGSLSHTHSSSEACWEGVWSGTPSRWRVRPNSIMFTRDNKLIKLSRYYNQYITPEPCFLINMCLKLFRQGTE